MLKKCRRTLVFMCAQLCIAWPFFSALHAEEIQEERPDPELIPSLKGILITGGSPPNEVQEICGVSFQHFDLPGLEKPLAETLQNYLHQPLTEKSLYSLKETIARFFEEHGHPVVIILVPEQEITNGQLRLQVIESKLKQVRVCQNKWFKENQILSQVRLTPNQPINSKKLTEDLRWLNRNPFREIDAIYLPGAEPYTTDVELLVRDRLPLRVYTGVDNTGIHVTGRTRYVAGLQASNFFHLDHLITYQFSSGNDYNEFHSHFLQYSCPFSWRHTLDLYGAYAHTQYDHSPIFNDGKSLLASMRYLIPLHSSHFWLTPEFAWGFDFKRTNNDLLFSDEPVFSKNVNLTQFAFSGRLGYRRNPHQFLLNANLYVSPFNLGGEDGERSHFDSLRPGANNKYAYLNAGFYYQLALPRNYSWTVDLRGQIASTKLLPSEQFGLGGYNTVRGYDEHDINRDNALLLNTEIRTPHIALLDRWHRRCYLEGLQFLAFLDYGFGVNHGLEDFRALAGIGPGFRYVIDPYLTIRCDWGIEINELVKKDPMFKSRLHFGLFLNL